MTDAEIELQVLRGYVAQHKAADLADPAGSDKCKRELDLRTILRDLKCYDDGEIDYYTKMWMERLAPEHVSGSSLRRCSNQRLNNDEHRFHLRAYVEGGMLPAWTRISVLEASTSTASSNVTPKPAIDVVTGLLARSEFDASFAAGLSGRAGPASLLVIDADNFKAVNDTHGHGKGDEVLKGIASLVQGVVLSKGAAFRYGGEEFVAFLPNHDQAESLSVAERIRKTIAASPVAGLSMTVSIGVATKPEHGSDAKTLFDAADRAMYDAKKRGRNLVRVSGEADPPTPQREPERRLPPPEGLSEAELKSIRSQYFRAHQALCPKDDAILDVQVSKQVGTATQTLFFHCGLCGLSGRA